MISNDGCSREILVSVSQKHSGPWTEILHTNLTDERLSPDPLLLQVDDYDDNDDDNDDDDDDDDPLLLQEFSAPPLMGRYVRLSVLSAHGWGGGLQYFRAYTGQIKEICKGENKTNKQITTYSYRTPSFF